LQDQLGRRGITRPLLCTFAIVLMGIGQIVLAFGASKGILFLGVVLTALAFGSTWCLIGPTSSDIVGPSNFGKVHTVDFFQTRKRVLLSFSNFVGILIDIFDHFHVCNGIDAHIQPNNCRTFL